MPKLTIALQDGYAHDDVRVEVDRRLVDERKDLSTRYQIGLAAQLTTEVEPGNRHVSISLVNRGLNAEASLEVQQDQYLSVSVENGELIIKPSSEPFRYA